MLSNFLSVFGNLGESIDLFADLFLSEQAFNYFFNEGGWLVFLRGVLRGIHIARFGW